MVRLARSLFWFFVGVALAAVPMLASAETWYAPNIVSLAGPSGSTADKQPFLDAIASLKASAIPVTAASQAEAGRFLATQLPSTIVVNSGSGYAGTYTADPAVVYGQYGRRTYLNGGFSATIDVGVIAVSYECETGEIDLDTGQCFKCPEGRFWNGTTCESPCQAKAGNSYGTNQNWATLDVATVPSASTNFCSDSCEVKGGKVECESFNSIGATGDRVELGTMCAVQGPFTYTGNGCGPEGTNPSLVGVDEQSTPWWDTGKDSKDCSASGGYWGQVNGDNVCVRPQPGENIQKETSTGNSPPSVESITNTDGTSTTKTTTTTTNCKDGSCTTTTTTTTTNTNADGTPAPGGGTETKTETQPVNDFCKANPTDPSCVGQTKDGAFSGTCEGGFKCTGDAVQCAIAEATWADRCMSAQMETENDFSTLYANAVTQSGQPATAIPEEDLSNLFTENSYVGGGVSCPSDISFSAFGRSITAPLGWLCSYLGIIALLLKTMAWLFVIRLIVTGI